MTKWYPQLDKLVVNLRRTQAAIVALNNDKRPEKSLRAFSFKEAASLLGISDTHLRNKVAEGGAFPQGEKYGTNRWFTLEEIIAARAHLHASSGNARYKVGRGEFDGPFTLAVTNFKGGVGKSTVAVHLSQYLALRGYRILLVDLDAQASSTALFGLDPARHVGLAPDGMPLLGGATLNPWIERREGDEGEAARLAVARTYWPNIDIVSANARLQSAENLLSARQSVSRTGHGEDRQYDLEVKSFIAHVGSAYDVVILDTSPYINLLAVNAFTAANGLLVPLLPSNVDLQSTTEFLAFIAKQERHMERYFGAGWPGWSFIKLLPNRYVSQSRPQAEIIDLMKKEMGSLLMQEFLVETSALGSANNVKWTLYEHVPAKSEDRTHKRALAAMDAIGLEIENQIQEFWGRSAAKEAALDVEATV